MVEWEPTYERGPLVRVIRYPWLAAALAAVCVLAIVVPIVVSKTSGASPSASRASLAPSSANVSVMPTGSAVPATLAPLIPGNDELGTPSPIPVEERPKAVFVGDSITRGDSEFASGYVGEMSWFYALVSAPDAPIAFAGGVADNGMLTSWMADHVWEALSLQPDMLVVLGGTNDISSGVSTQESLGNLQRIVDAAHQAGVKVAVSTIPPSDQEGLDQRARDYDAALVAWADSAGVIILDTAAPLRGAEGRGWGDGLTRDGTHPSAAGAVLMSQAAATTLRYLDQ